MPLNGEGPLSEKRLIVVLDDSATVLAMVRLGLERLGFSVCTAADASELVAEDVRRAALVVVDVQMEQVFGDDVVQFLRDCWQVVAPIYLYSSIPRDELARRASRSGATGFVSKSDGVGKLVAEVQRVLGGV